MRTATSDLTTTPRKPDPSAAIAAKKAQKEANRKRIAAAITRLAAAGEAVNVMAVARAAGVHSDTIRRNEDLLAEVLKHRAGGVGRTATRAGGDAAVTALRARLATAQGEIKDLRTQLAVTTKAAHQALGTTPPAMDHVTAEQLKQENAEMAVALVAAQATARDLTRQRDDLHEELLASHDVNRDYVRQLTQSNEHLLNARRQIAALRHPQPPHG